MAPFVQIFVLGAMVVVAIALVARFGAIPRAGVLPRLVLAIAASLTVFVVPLFTFGCSCGAGNNPVRQATLAAAATLLCGLFVGPIRARAATFALYFAAAMVAAWHFHAAVLPSDRSLCRYTGDPDFVANSCERPVHARRVWYSRLTGLHPLSE